MSLRAVHDHPDGGGSLHGVLHVHHGGCSPTPIDLVGDVDPVGGDVSGEFGWVIVCCGDYLRLYLFPLLRDGADVSRIVESRWKYLPEPYKSEIITFATKKQVVPDFHMIFLRGIGCNWLVCLACFLGLQGLDLASKILGI
ncbi:uncharacterized protein ATNIH1004_010264 [Aspergillus tanneri]|uniref:Uncharacterized protein n=1 Tax=Aspergillus tanneri TaxID=1220188 RepID=A0A5M9M8W8_9EURO|nr:uncharacterized protein ATNIH1004_010264 [Aspergillus tanneri]KAA8643495.1 hypothetical protein ATNIH1004_010264 [Aspergillus tanneri]